jgi:hypothetical protein
MAIRLEKLNDPAVANGVNQAIPHALGAVPDIYFITNDTDALIVESVATPPDAAAIYVDNSIGGPGNCTAVAFVL